MAKAKGKSGVEKKVKDGKKDASDVSKASLKANPRAGSKVGSKADLGPLSKLKNISEIRKYYDLQDEHLTINLVLHKMSEVLEMYLKTLQQILQPEEFHAIYECNAFTENEKTKIFELYKRLIIAHREILKAVVANEEKDLLSTITFVHEELSSVKTQMFEIVHKMQQSWKGDSKIDSEKKAHYFG